MQLSRRKAHTCVVWQAREAKAGRWSIANGHSELVLIHDAQECRFWAHCGRAKAFYAKGYWSSNATRRSKFVRQDKHRMFIQLIFDEVLRSRLLPSPFPSMARTPRTDRHLGNPTSFPLSYPPLLFSLFFFPITCPAVLVFRFQVIVDDAAPLLRSWSATSARNE